MPIHSNIPSEDSITPQTNVLSGSLKTIFEHSDYNIILNNIPGARISSYYFDVDYSYDAFRPVNLSLILSGSAAISVVQDSNYTSYRVISSRYKGSKTISLKYNDYTEGDDSYGKTAAIDLYTNYFAYFEEVQDAFPKATRGSKVAISKLIDKEGKVIPLDSRNINLFDVSNIFKPNKKAFIYYTEVPSGSFSNIQNVLTKSVDESGFLYTTVAFYKPTQTPPPLGIAPEVGQDDNRLYYSLLDTRNVSGVYIDKTMYGYNSIISQNATYENNRMYFYYGLHDSSSSGLPASPFTSTGYFLGMGLILRNFYPGTGEQYESYRDYPWVRFEHISGGAQNYNIDINEDLLPLQIGDRFRIYDATEASFNEVYAYDKDVFFIQNASGSSIQYTMYDSEITDIQFTLPTSINIFTSTTGSGTGSLLAETFFISSDTASVYLTDDRFSTIDNISPANSFTRILPASNTNNIDITPGPYVVGQHDESLGYGVSFKKLYKIRDFSSNIQQGYTEYPYWALGTSGSLFRSKNNLSFEQVNLGMNPSLGLNAMFILPNSEPANVPGINYYGPSNISWLSSFKRGYMFVVGDSGSMYGSSDYGNTWTSLNFPRTDINLYDVNFCRDNNGGYFDYLIVTGNSGSIYNTSGSSLGVSYPGGAAIYQPLDTTALQQNWASTFNYNNIYDSLGNLGSWPPSQRREDMVFTRIVPLVCNIIGVHSTNTTIFLYLTNSGSLFTYFNVTNYNTFGAGGNDSLIAYTGSLICPDLTPPGGAFFNASSNLIDAFVTGSVYDDLFNLHTDPNFVVQAVLLDKNGQIYINNNVYPSDALSINGGLSVASHSLIYDANANGYTVCNELRALNSIDYNTNALSNQLWIPTSNGVLLSSSMSDALSGLVLPWSVVDPILYFNYVSSSFGRVEPHGNFYSMIEVNEYNPNNPFNTLYVQLTFRDRFDPTFYNTVGSSVYPYGVNADFPNYIQNGDYTGTRQAFRLYRRYSNEQYVLTKEHVNDGKGFIIPENYNPNLNYVELAKKAGLLI